MKLKNLIKTSAVIIPVISGISGCTDKTESHPNIVVILSDDQGWGDLSINGNHNLQTPNVDRLAHSGIRLTRFYVCPVSSPTRAEFLTGRYHSRSGVYSTSQGGERMNTDETTIAEVFKSAGYVTGAFGKWHNGMQYPYHPNARGFNEYYGFCSGHWGNYFSPMLEHNGKIVQGNGYITNDLTEKAMEFIEKNKDTQFFLYVPYNTPHSPMQVPDTWWDKFSDKQLEMFADERVNENIPFTRAALAMCENVDWNVGRIMDKLKELDLEKNTILLYFSDNGPNSWRWNDGMRGRKGSTDEGGVRSPLIIRWPGKINEGSQTDRIAGAIDLLPTLADMAGIELRTQKPLDGISLKSLLLGQEDEVIDRYIFSNWNGNVSVRSQNYRLDNQDRLYDMINDPGQYNDISASEKTVTEELKSALENWKNTGTTILPNREARSEDHRRFPVGHPDFRYTQLPARDAFPQGNIIRSAGAPNCSFFTNWTDTEDKIIWNVEVLSEGDYEAEIYYTCPEKDTGAVIELSFNSDRITAKVNEANDPPLRGMENDRVKRGESYVKDFKPLNAGTIHLEKGTGELTLKALEIPGTMAIDFRLLMLTRVN